MYFISFLLKKNPISVKKRQMKKTYYTEIANIGNYCDNIFLVKPKLRYYIIFILNKLYNLLPLKLNVV